MSQAKFSMDLDWKEGLHLDMNAVEAWLRANAGPSYCGNSAHSKLQLWFTDEPSVEIKDLIQTYWDHLDANSDEAKSYMPQADRQKAQEAKASSGKAKLKALGLTDDEIAALLG